MPYRLSTFGFNDMMDCRARLRALYDDDTPSTLTGAAERAVEFFLRELVDEDGGPACALVRFFKTHPYADLPHELQDLVQNSVPDPAPDLRCLTLLATRGQEPAWNATEHSRGHRAIPLVSEEMVRQAPMIAPGSSFVVPYAIESVLGFGGLLATGDLFAVIMFSKVPIPPDVADQFRVVALNLKVAILPFARKPLV